MKIIVLLCFIVGVLCFAAKDALDVRTAQLAKEQLTYNSFSVDTANRAQAGFNS